MSVCELNNHNTLDFIGQTFAQSNILYITHYIITFIGKKNDASAYAA